MQVEVSDEIRDGLKSILETCSKSKFMATSIVMHSQSIREYTPTYNNNTPFDMANAFLGLKADSETLREIISGYLKHQNKDGYWFLNFSREYSVNTWTTSEALIVLNRALDQYLEIEIADQRAEIEQEKVKVEKENGYLKDEIKKLRHKLVLSSAISMLLSIMSIVIIIKCTSLPDIKDSFFGNMLSTLAIPFIIWSFKEAFELIKSIIRLNSK